MFAVTSRISADRSTSAVCRFSFPELTRATSRRVVARRRYALTSPSSSSRPCTSPAGTPPAVSRALANSSSNRALIGVIGLRSSCAAIARKSSRARSSASSSATRSASAVSRTVGPFAGGILKTALRSCRFRRIFIKTLWRGRSRSPARTPALRPRQHRQFLKQGRASSRSAAPADGVSCSRFRWRPPAACCADRAAPGRSRSRFGLGSRPSDRAGTPVRGGPLLRRALRA